MTRLWNEEEFDKRFGVDNSLGEGRKANLKSFIDSQFEEYQERLVEKIEKLKDVEEFDEVRCSKCDKLIRGRLSHHDEDGYSQCCGKRLVRKQGTRKSWSDRNGVLDDVIRVIKNG